MLRRVAERIDVSAINRRLADNAALFGEIASRQVAKSSPHADTETIFLVGPAEMTADSAQHTLSLKAYPALQIFQCELVDILQTLEPIIGITDYGRSMIVKLRPGGKIEPHRDEGGYAEHYSRLHIVLQSAPEFQFWCGADAVWMQPGEVWWFDHQQSHGGHNGSSADRIHLIVDVVANELPRPTQTDAHFVAEMRQAMGF